MSCPKRGKALAKALRESAQPISTVRQHVLPVIRDSYLHSDLQAMLGGNQELMDTCITDGTPLQEDEVNSTILEALTKFIEDVKCMVLQLGEGLNTIPQSRAAVSEAASSARLATTSFQDNEKAITSAADKRTTMPSLLRRLAKKCKRHPHLIHTIKIWWDNAQEELLDESDEAKLKLMETLFKEVEESWELPNWLPKITQRAL